MIKKLNRLADRFVGLMLPRLEAGACVPEMGQLYWRNCGGCGCTSDGRYIRKQCECRISCSGTCVSTGRTRCVTTQLLC